MAGARDRLEKAGRVKSFALACPGLLRGSEFLRTALHGKHDAEAQFVKMMPLTTASMHQASALI